jgi:hypothetical protein
MPDLKFNQCAKSAESAIPVSVDFVTSEGMDVTTFTSDFESTTT